MDVANEKSESILEGKSKVKVIIDKVCFGLFCFSIAVAILSIGYMLLVTMFLSISIRGYFFIPFLLAIIGVVSGLFSFLFRLGNI